GAPRVVIGVVEHHALAAPQSQHGLADLVHRRALSGLNTDPACQLRILDRCRQLIGGKPKGYRKDHVTARVPLKPTGSIAEAAVVRTQLTDPFMPAVPRSDGR